MKPINWAKCIGVDIPQEDEQVILALCENYLYFDRAIWEKKEGPPLM